MNFWGISSIDDEEVVCEVVRSVSSIVTDGVRNIVGQDLEDCITSWTEGNNLQEFKDIGQHAKFLSDFQQPVTQEKMIAQQNRKQVNCSFKYLVFGSGIKKFLPCIAPG
ncbi:hypothetical protein PV325_005437 [Microctonus aethiopoides]|nr:hypothetical protein PV325_005437 [Microctonus aethiopoides]KAK0083971.1 hypothetical protein PV326_006455 [Microctonus aethiopoides]